MIFLTFYITFFLKISRTRSSEMEIDYRRTGESVSLHSKIFFSCIYTARKKRLRRMSRPRRRKGFCGSCEARCTPISNQKRRRFVESVHRFGETPFKFDTPDLGRDRRTRYGSKSISRLSRIHCRLFLRSIIYSWNRGNRENTRVLREGNGQRGGLEIGEWALECPPPFRRFCGERVKPGEIHRRCAYSSSPSDFFTSIHPRFATLLDRIWIDNGANAYQISCRVARSIFKLFVQKIK